MPDIPIRPSPALDTTGPPRPSVVVSIMSVDPRLPGGDPGSPGLLVHEGVVGRPLCGSADRRGPGLGKILENRGLAEERAPYLTPFPPSSPDLPRKPIPKYAYLYDAVLVMSVRSEGIRECADCGTSSEG